MKKRNRILSLLMMFCCLLMVTTQANAQSQSVNGVVSDVNGVSIPGVSVVEKGTQNGTVTNIDGVFEIQVASPNAIVVYSFIGFKTIEVPVDLTKKMMITLEENLLGLDEVVVIGYGSVQKSDVTGAVSSVKMKDISLSPSNSVDGLLQGRSAGVQVVSSSDDPGAGSTIRIRGGSSYRSGNEPLVVVDGFPIGNAGDIKQISPSDIESMEILKDASSTAIYGSRGANGVIMITTKKGAKNTTEVTISQQNTISEFTSDLNLWRDPVLMAELNNEKRVNGGFVPLYIGANDPNGVYYPSVGELKDGSWKYNTRWDDVVFRNPISNNTNIAIRSQNEKTQFSLSTTYFTDEGVYIDDNYKKLNTNLNIVHKAYDKLTVGTNVLFTKGERNNNGGLAYYRNPIFPVYNDGDASKGYYMVGTQDYSHPIALTDNKSNKNEFLDFLGTAFAEAQLLPSLKLKSQINYKFSRSITDFYNPNLYTEDGTFNNGAGGIDNSESSETISESFLTFDKTLNEVHKINAMAGFSYRYKKNQTSNLRAYDFLNESLGSGNLSGGSPEKQSVDNSLSEEVMYSYMGRLNYVYDSKYLATVTMRADASSKFGENNKWGYFPSGALGWKMHHEDFIKDLNVFDELKLRTSFGISGNQEPIGAYLINSQYGQDQYYVNGGWQTAIGPGYIGRWDEQTGKKLWSGIPNPDLKWETTEQFNVGLDMAFFGRRLRVIADYYNKHTNDLLRERYLSPSSAYDLVYVNGGEIKNEGIELTFDADIINKNDWKVSGTLIFSKNKNEVVSLGNELAFGLNTDPNTGMQYEFNASTIEAFRAKPNILGIGEAVNVFYGYKVDGIIQNNQEGLAAGLTGKDAEAGEFKYVDINEDGVIDSKDRTIIGDPNPDFTASLSLQVSYKNFDLAMLFNGSFGQDIFNTKAFSEPSNEPLRWTPDNPTNKYPSLRDGRNLQMSDWFVQDGSYVRLQNVSLGYNIPNLGISWFKRGRIYMNATNLFTITNFDGYDPEVGSDGIYWGGYPKLRKWTLGVELTF
ncbi:TonB-dependent receptor [Ancylomarina sp. 16SWW S1-10-2]|uniref:SusC/RagA family TonB-linked outer membrane protein n=1 Tax=Ancylomarina sp. 16SWW S1-10-2 TaxID=2499681 RepID=UPI0012AD88DD|nr:TonB-dependent receptor [Ancylomarina sp. 16SWW S1-10-2]MRT93714.1 TonB-dependent receptor [Ancylomarina sp. 16SWW S1-10-2]